MGSCKFQIGGQVADLQETPAVDNSLLHTRYGAESNNFQEVQDISCRPKVTTAYRVRQVLVQRMEISSDTPAWCASPLDVTVRVAQINSLNSERIRVDATSSCISGFRHSLATSRTFQHTASEELYYLPPNKLWENRIKISTTHDLSLFVEMTVQQEAALTLQQRDAIGDNFCCLFVNDKVQFGKSLLYANVLAHVAITTAAQPDVRVSDTSAMCTPLSPSRPVATAPAVFIARDHDDDNMHFVPVPMMSSLSRQEDEHEAIFHHEPRHLFSAARDAGEMTRMTIARRRRRWRLSVHRQRTSDTIALDSDTTSPVSHCMTILRVLLCGTRPSAKVFPAS